MMIIYPNSDGSFSAQGTDSTGRVICIEGDTRKQTRANWMDEFQKRFIAEEVEMTMLDEKRYEDARMLAADLRSQLNNR